jgi:hypothetical protein
MLLPRQQALLASGTTPPKDSALPNAGAELQHHQSVSDRKTRSLVYRRLAVVAISVVTVVLLDGIKPCCTSANAQTQTTSPDPTIWDHNGSVMYLIDNGSSREFHYQKPRPAMLEAGARPGSLLFRGQVDNGQYSGTAYIFNPHCGAIPFQVKGSALDNDERIMLTGQVPQVGQNCRLYGSYTTNLEFRRLKPADATQSQEALEATQARGVEQSKFETSSAKETENSPREVTEPKVSVSTPTARLPVTKGAPSAAKDPDNYTWAIVLMAVVLVVSAAAMVAAA